MFKYVVWMVYVCPISLNSTYFKFLSPFDRKSTSLRILLYSRNKSEEIIFSHITTYRIYLFETFLNKSQRSFLFAENSNFIFLA